MQQYLTKRLMRCCTSLQGDVWIENVTKGWSVGWCGYYSDGTKVYNITDALRCAVRKKKKEQSAKLCVAIHVSLRTGAVLCVFLPPLPPASCRLICIVGAHRVCRRPTPTCKLAHTASRCTSRRCPKWWHQGLLTSIAAWCSRQHGARS